VLLLLDTHAFLWWLDDDSELGPEARAAIGDGENLVFVSAATGWEISVKRASGKLEAPGDIAGWVRDSGFIELPIELDHAVLSGELPKHHRDPFDRILIAQATLEDQTLITADADVRKYDVRTHDASK
jgi:PIN domain nuclease of toxin-antitoxin system